MTTYTTLHHPNPRHSCRQPIHQGGVLLGLSIILRVYMAPFTQPCNFMEEQRTCPVVPLLPKLMPPQTFNPSMPSYLCGKHWTSCTNSGSHGIHSPKGFLANKKQLSFLLTGHGTVLLTFCLMPCPRMPKSKLLRSTLTRLLQQDTSVPPPPSRILFRR